MRAKVRVRYRGFVLLIAFSLAAGVLAGQDAARTKEQTDDAVEMIADVGVMLNVRGNRIATPLAPPRPGSTPMITPSMIPITITSRLNG